MMCPCLTGLLYSMMLGIRLGKRLYICIAGLFTWMSAAMRYCHALWDNPAVPTNVVFKQHATPSAYVNKLEPGVAGCAGASSLELVKIFGDLPADVIHEDNAISMRSILWEGFLLFVDTPLVKYRLHDSNLFNARHAVASTLNSIKDQEHRMWRLFKSRATMYRVFCEDLIAAKNLGAVSDEEFSRAYTLAKRNERLHALQSEFMTSNTVKKTRTLIQLARQGATIQQLGKLLLRMAPAQLFQTAKLLRGRLHYALQPESSR